MHISVQQPNYSESETSAAFYLSEGRESSLELYGLQQHEGNPMAMHTHQRSDQRADTRNEMLEDSRVEFWRALDEKQVFYSTDVDR